MQHSAASWRTYEDVARYLLNRLSHHFGLSRVEGKQAILGRESGTSWEADARGVMDTAGDAFVLIECRRYTTSRLKQEDLAAIAYKIHDMGAAGGIVVSPLGFQEGARKIAESERIEEVTLSSESTTVDFILKFLNRILGVTPETVEIGEEVRFVLKRGGE